MVIFSLYTIVQRTIRAHFYTVFLGLSRQMYSLPLKCSALAKTEHRIWLIMSWIHLKLVPFCQNPLKHVTIFRSHFGLLSAYQNLYFGRNRNFTKTPNLGRYLNRNIGPSLFSWPKNQYHCVMMHHFCICSTFIQIFLAFFKKPTNRWRAYFKEAHPHFQASLIKER